MRLDVPDPAAFVSRFHEVLEDLEPVRMTKLRKAAGRFAEPKRCVSLGQHQPQPCKEGRKQAIGAGWRRLPRGFASLNKPAPPSPTWLRRRPMSSNRWSLRLRNSRANARRSRFRRMDRMRPRRTLTMLTPYGSNILETKNYYPERQEEQRMLEAGPRASGSCLCGAVRYVVTGPLRDVTVCHCVFCQRSSTSVGAYAACAPEHLSLLAGRPRWHRSSPTARRGFCAKCGSQLFWEPSHGRHVSVAAGSLDQPTGLRTAQHIFCEQIGDYDRPVEAGSKGSP